MSCISSGNRPTKPGLDGTFMQGADCAEFDGRRNLKHALFARIGQDKCKAKKDNALLTDDPRADLTFTIYAGLHPARLNSTLYSPTP
jgi:hypothetical protein